MLKYSRRFLFKQFRRVGPWQALIKKFLAGQYSISFSPDPPDFTHPSTSSLPDFQSRPILRPGICLSLIHL